MKQIRVIASVSAAGLLLVAVACTQQGSTSSSPVVPTAGLSAQSDGALAATIDFGRDDLGSPFPPPSGHDQSGHSRDSLFPREVVINTHGVVTFVMGASGVHQVAIYAPGTSPDDIDATNVAPGGSGCPGVPLINDGNHRIAVLSDQVCHGGSSAPTFKFDRPGKYLVICTFVPHFQVGMYGWVTVRDK